MGLWSSLIITTCLILIVWELRDIKKRLDKILEHFGEEDDEEASETKPKGLGLLPED